MIQSRFRGAIASSLVIYWKFSTWIHEWDTRGWYFFKKRPFHSQEQRKEKMDILLPCCYCTWISLQLGDSLHHAILVSWTDWIVSIVDITQGLHKESRLDRPNATHCILVQESISTNSHFNFCAFHQIDSWIELLEFFQTKISKYQNIVERMCAMECQTTKKAQGRILSLSLFASLYYLLERQKINALLKTTHRCMHLRFQVLSFQTWLDRFHNRCCVLVNRQSTIHDNPNRPRIRWI